MLTTRTFLYIIAIIINFNTAAWAIETKATQALLLDFQTGTVLFEKNADVSMVPSSMTKIMTIYMVFDLMRENKLKLDDTFTVSKYAWRKGGSRMYVEVGSKVSIDNLIQGIIVHSGNDASIVVAEGISGNEAVFAAEMTKQAYQIGAKNTIFKNATGWPNPQHLTTARDLAIISTRLIHDFPKQYATYFSQKEFTYNNITQKNRNPLVHQNIGADGIKTGQTEAGGAGLVGSAVQNGRRLLLVINGCKDGKEREREAENLLQWGFKTTVTPKVLTKDKALLQAHVWLGDKPKVSLQAKEDLYITLPRSELKKLKVEAYYSDPLPAPLTVGQEVGKIVITLPNLSQIEKPLIVKEDVNTCGFFERIRAAFNYLLFGSNEQG